MSPRTSEKYVRDGTKALHSFFDIEEGESWLWSANVDQAPEEMVADTLRLHQ